MWPVLIDEAAATAATAALLGDAEKLLNTEPEAAMSVVSGACAQLSRWGFVTVG